MWVLAVPSCQPPSQLCSICPFTSKTHCPNAFLTHWAAVTGGSGAAVKCLGAVLCPHLLAHVQENSLSSLCRVLLVQLHWQAFGFVQPIL